MGGGVIGPLGDSPVGKFALVIGLINNVRLKASVVALLSGSPVRSTDDAVQISWQAKGPSGGVLVIRDAERTDRVLLYIWALTHEEIDSTSSPSAAGLASPLPDAWREVVNDTEQTWELFNCKVESVIYRPD